MSRFTETLTAISNVLRAGLGLILVLALIWGVIYIQQCNNDRSYEQYNANKAKPIKEKTYRPPVIKTPITPDKPPIEKKKLPIHPKTVKRTIEIKTETPEGQEIKTILVVDKKDNFYTIADNKTEISITEWKPPIVAFDFRLGYSLVASNKVYHCLSLDYIRVWKIYLGSEIGVKVKDRQIDDYLIGLSLKYKTLEVKTYSLNLVAGYDFINSKPYVGLNLKF